ncbi:DUF4136 domain-containing protein [Pseudomonas sp. CCC3.1]|uniref:DUF4136 domain-containing protein n=1 Tax=Pseudomonas sp. CCC3.1 TaxID=3048607 RepID=UPI002AC92440|nr:DUF4136 domain-containing protein [Pseudomonas sp. CCC3.1]MEB0205553.1 DUF4136 domain-containing protein [Pseudomonas sp. CCC3.1]WPX35542.1 DUF4136 domain-containing protein [Pseudomonas sp. CCC3.1]
MLRRIALLGLALLLSACESMQVSHDFNPAVDFAQFRTWAWKDPAVQYQPNNPMLKSDLTEQRIIQAVSSQLDQRGLRPVAAGGKPDLLVQTYLIVANRQEQVVTNYGYGGPWGGPWGVYGGGPWGGYWGPAAYNETRNVIYQVGTLQIDLTDAKDGRLVWRGSAEKVLNDSPTPQERSAAIREAVTKILNNYPPK